MTEKTAASSCMKNLESSVRERKFVVATLVNDLDRKIFTPLKPVVQLLNLTEEFLEVQLWEEINPIEKQQWPIHCRNFTTPLKIASRTKLKLERFGDSYETSLQSSFHIQDGTKVEGAVLSLDITKLVFADHHDITFL